MMARPSKLPPSTPPAATARSVLVVDDEELNRHLYGALLTSAGYQVEVACDGVEAVSRLGSVRPDAVLLDFAMPRLDGPGVLRWMRASPDHADTPVLLLTASGEAQSVSEAFDAGADDYLLKPVNPRILVARIRSTIAARDTSRRAEHAERRERRGEALRERLLVDLEEARTVQVSQLPAFPMLRDKTWVSGHVCSSGHVGGDIIDVVTLDDGTSVSFLVDVAGHGTAAALVASSIRSELRFLLASSPLDEALVRLGRRLSDDGAARHACVGLVAMRGLEFSIINAGLPPIWVGTPKRPRMLVTSSGPPPGLFDARGYDIQRGVLAPGEVIAVVSDGLTEPFGYADEVGHVGTEILDGVPTSVAPPPEVFAERIDALFAHAGISSMPDDATVLTIGVAA